MSINTIKSCPLTCPLCDHDVHNVCVLDQAMSQCVWWEIYVSSAEKGFLDSGYLHRVMRSEVQEIDSSIRINLLDDDVYFDHMTELLIGIEDFTEDL